MPKQHAVIILLAGKSSRMGQPKQHTIIGEKSFLDHILSTLSSVSAHFSPIILVGSEGDIISPVKTPPKGIWLTNHEIDLGPLHSIHLALDHIPEDQGFFLWPVDHPLVQQTTLGHLLEEVERTPEAIVIPSFDHRRGHPPYFPAWTKADLKTAPLEKGARWVLEKHAEHIKHISVSDRWVLHNINTPERLVEAEKHLSSPSLF